MKTPKMENLEFYKYNNGNVTHLWDGETTYKGYYRSSNRRPKMYCGQYANYSSNPPEKVDQPKDVTKCCATCYRKSQKNNIDMLKRFNTMTNNNEEEKIDMIPEVPVFAIRTGESMWDIYRDGKKAGEFHGPAEFVQKLIDAE